MRPGRAPGEPSSLLPMATSQPDPLVERYKKSWARMDRADRRRVMRAVNRMQPLEDPAEAALAVMFAQRQRRMWIRWWWVLPAVNGAIGWPGGWQMVLVNIVIGGVIVGVFVSLFVWRAGRSAKVNREVLETAQKRRRSGSPKKRATAPKRGGSRRQRKRRR
jgi:hypothetical protein